MLHAERSPWVPHKTAEWPATPRGCSIRSCRPRACAVVAARGQREPGPRESTRQGHAPGPRGSRARAATTQRRVQSRCGCARAPHTPRGVCAGGTPRGAVGLGGLFSLLADTQTQETVPSLCGAPPVRWRTPRGHAPRGARGASGASPQAWFHFFGRDMPGDLAMDSDLDASSQYPSHGGFATPAARLIAETRGVARGFLSYYHVLPSSCPRAHVGRAVPRARTRTLGVCVAPGPRGARRAPTGVSYPRAVRGPSTGDARDAPGGTSQQDLSRSAFGVSAAGG